MASRTQVHLGWSAFRNVENIAFEARPVAVNRKPMSSWRDKDCPNEWTETDELTIHRKELPFGSHNADFCGWLLQCPEVAVNDGLDCGVELTAD